MTIKPSGFCLNVIEKLKLALGTENLSFLKHARNYVTGEFFSKGITFLSIPILTRLLSPADYGLLSIFNTLIFILVIVTSLNLPASIKRIYFEKGVRFNEALGTSILSLFCIHVLVVFIYLNLRILLSSFFQIPAIILDFALMVSIMMSVIQLYQQYLQATQNSFRYSLISVALNGLALLIGIGIVFNLSNNKYLGLVYSRFSVVLLTGIIIFFLLVKLSKFKFNTHYFRYLLGFGVPLIPHSLSGFILAFFDRIIIQQLASATETGLYSFAYNIGMIMNIIVISLNNSWVPIFYKMMNEKQYKKINHMLQNYAKYIFIFALLLIMFTKDIVVIMADKKYFSSFDIIPIIVLSYVLLFLYTIYSNYIFYSKRTYIISLNTLIAATINIILNYWLIPVYGYKIAAFTTLISFLALFLFHFISVRLFVKNTPIFAIRSLLKSGLIFMVYFIIALLILFSTMPLFISIPLKLTLTVAILLTFYPKIREMIR